jgi:LPXTG-motif cell wall-anchored protein
MVVGPLAALGGMLLLGAVAVVVIRRRPEAVTQ